MTETAHNGWTLRFRSNVHMYCHDLTATKGDHELQVPCEDMPSGGVGIWPYALELDTATYTDLLVALRLWAAGLDSDYRLYVTRDESETN